MENIIKDLKSIQEKIEALDDPTASKFYRELIGGAHYSIEECMDALKIANQPLDSDAKKPPQVS